VAPATGVPACGERLAPSEVQDRPFQSSGSSVSPGPARAALELYASPINFDPDTPPFPISAPPEYARELSGKWTFTRGLIEDTSA